jgi:hypothetical protein
MTTLIWYMQDNNGRVFSGRIQVNEISIMCRWRQRVKDTDPFSRPLLLRELSSSASAYPRNLRGVVNAAPPREPLYHESPLKSYALAVIVRPQETLCPFCAELEDPLTVETVLFTKIYQQVA